jgi:hypothetical protein
MDRRSVHVTPAPADFARAVREAKAALRRGAGDVRAALAEVEHDLRREVAALQAERDAGVAVFPVVRFEDVAGGRVPEQAADAIRRRGCAVVKGTFPRARAEGWDRELVRYLDANAFARRWRGPADDVFGGLASRRPQIYGIYWSGPQMEARQDENMAAVRTFLNGFWRHESEGRRWFDPGRDTAYPDRIRRREPGSASLGLSPHADNGSVERWLLPAYQKVFRHVFAGRWREYDAWDAAYRPDVYEFRSTVMCSAFRTFQGWTALSDMRPSDGVLHVVPIPSAMAYVLLRALQDDVPEDDLCGAVNGQALPVGERWHGLLLPALTPIPAVEPGDTVWWHCDLVHGVGDETTDERWGNVMYIPAAPWCGKNEVYARACGQAFLEGASPADFAPEDYETAFTGRPAPEDLSPLGRKQLGLEPW